MIMNNVFIHVPKTAGKSVRLALNKNKVDFTDLGHSNKNIDVLFSDPEIFTFCFVRNPAERLKSAFFHLIEFYDLIDKNNPTNFENEIISLKETYGSDFKKFILDSGFKKFKIAHFYPQTLWTHTENNKISFIGRFEDLEGSWKELSNILGVKYKPLEHINDTKLMSYIDNKSDYNNEMLRIVKCYYKDDYKKLGY